MNVNIIKHEHSDLFLKKEKKKKETVVDAEITMKIIRITNKKCNVMLFFKVVL